MKRYFYRSLRIIGSKAPKYLGTKARDPASMIQIANEPEGIILETSAKGLNAELFFPSIGLSSTRISTFSSLITRNGFETFANLMLSGLEKR